MNLNKEQKGIAAIGKLIGFSLVLILVMVLAKALKSDEVKDISSDMDLVIIKVYKDSEIVDQVATVPDKPVSFGSYKVVFQKSK